MWHRLCTITDYKVKDIAMVTADSAVADELNAFYTRFEVSQAVGSIYSLTTDDNIR